LSLAGSSSREFYFKKLRRYGPVFKLFWGSGNLKVCVVGYPRARRLLSEHADVLAPISIDIESLVPRGFLRCMSGADHARYRRLFKEALHARLLTHWEPEIRNLIRNELSTLAGDSQSDLEPAARLLRTLERIATQALLALFFGVLREDPEFDELAQGFVRLGPEGIVHPIGAEQAAAFSAIHTVVLRLVGALQADDSTGQRDTVFHRLTRAERESTSDPTVVGNAIYMVDMGRHDIRGLLRWILKYLSDNAGVPAELRTLGKDADARQRLAEACVLETLRMDQAEGLNRRATREFTFEGYRIPEGSNVCTLLRETHRDPAVFDEPDRFDPHRFLGRRYSADEYAPFGIGAHRCIADALVTRLGTIFVEELVMGFEWSVAEDGPLHRGKYHWEPAAVFAIDLSVRRES
jgi:cytochrome P450